MFDAICTAMPGRPEPSLSCTKISNMPGFLGSHRGSAMAKRKSPTSVGVIVGGVGVSSVTVGPGVGEGVLLAGGISVGVGVMRVGVGAGVLVYSGRSVVAQLDAP